MPKFKKQTNGWTDKAIDVYCLFYKNTTQNTEGPRGFHIKTHFYQLRTKK